ncbi:FAD/FMN-containing dehydrogenase [Microbacterium terrae]|uniref:Mitomycin radical oxidase n=1 Tax=Microbacterium terrae TaxID=69369 RepID=A0A0M2GW52_9MICO|nr:FAD-binding oxidoreductase [Microbacterium terrae]KJL37727.1 Mitomycin radical oxidase [Microbacterium terrae]MBP1076559.1 FAD/FMN-containing dehydrogenase [Microbacterium terrae]GLJ97388.1 FAD-linked oxidase [Microbacterium terrae]
MTIDLLALTVDQQRGILRDALGDRILFAGDAGYDDQRRPWNTAFDQRPFAVARPENTEDVVDAVRAAVAVGLRVAPQSTGHGAGALADTDLSDTVLMSLSRLRGVSIDPATSTATVLGGSHWNDVLLVAAHHGLTALHGSAGDVSVAGYSLNGGLSFYARAHGLAVNSVRAVELVTADGVIVRASATENADLFWAVRGGSGSFGVVVSLEIELLPLADVFAGMLLWDASHTAEVTEAWAQFAASAPESATTALRVMNFPPMPELPPFLSGRSVVVVDGAILESDAVAEGILAPLRSLAPEIDTFSRIPAAALVAVHMDPPDPTPSVNAHVVLSGFPADAVDTFVTVSATPGLFVTEIRHIGGAAARPASHGGAVSAIAGEFLLHAITVVPVPQARPGALATVQAGAAAFTPWRTDALALTFIDGGADPRAGFGDAAERLSELKEQFDPEDVFAAARPVSR